MCSVVYDGVLMMIHVVVVDRRPRTPIVNVKTEARSLSTGLWRFLLLGPDFRVVDIFPCLHNNYVAVFSGCSACAAGGS